MKPLEKFLKKQSSTLARGGFSDKSRQLQNGLKRRCSVSKILPSFLKDSPSEIEISSLKAESEDCSTPSVVSPPDTLWLDLPPALDLKSPSFSSEDLSPGFIPHTFWEATLAPLLSPSTPEALLSRVLDSLTGTGSTGPAIATDAVLDDFILTHSVFLPADQLLHTLHERFCASGLESTDDIQKEKQAVLTVAVRYMETYKDILPEEEQLFQGFKELSLLAEKDMPLYPNLVNDTLMFLQLVEETQTKVAEDSDLLKKRVKPLFRHFRRIDSCLQPREAFRGSDEIFCRVYTPNHSYVTIRGRLSATVQEILSSVSEKLLHSEDQCIPEEELILVAVTSSGEKILFKPDEDCVFTTLGVNTNLFACSKESLDSLVPLPEQTPLSPGDTEVHSMEADEVANQLTLFDWELFTCIHESEFVSYVFRNDGNKKATANLELLLQRCSEVQHWVATEMLLSEALGKRVQLLKKFIRTAEICLQNQNFLSFFAIVMGLDNSAVSRLRLTWEKLPEKLKKLFKRFENVTDPCRNHKSYREFISKMKPPVIPFVPLVLKDITFLHESRKTFQNGLVNFEKMHTLADTLRAVRRYRSIPLTLDMESMPVPPQRKAYIRQLQVIDNPNLLSDLSLKLEPNSI
ncbi:rap guanine nucleotide exchange factor-like 1 [Protopterus annectens]|uniref:rap guanine nucleotide exchange factor-like 1 n=1 Tax=Protopterus annectens TaxID=7888 RepID=UPI001CFA185B|nr:rap guanine nucleotide exchange factor-like 1 [Protopterus annectens]